MGIFLSTNGHFFVKNYKKWSINAIIQKLVFLGLYNASLTKKYTKNGNFLPKILSFGPKMVIFCHKSQKVANFGQKEKKNTKKIQKLLFLGQFNAFLKKKLQKMVIFVFSVNSMNFSKKYLTKIVLF